MKRLIQIIILLIFLISFTSAYAVNLVRVGHEYVPQYSAGRPLAYADIYVGEPDTDPTVAGNQKQLYIQEEDGTFTAITQPVTTGSGGIPLYSGDPVALYVSGAYSIKVLDSGDSQVYYNPNVVPQYEPGITTVPLLSDYLDLADAVTTIGATPTELWIDEDAVMDENVTAIPTTLKMKFIEGNTITTTGYTLGFSGGSQAHIIALPGQQIFDGTGSVTGLTKAYPQWFGADDTGSVGSYAELQATIDAADVIWLTGTFGYDTTLVVPEDKTIDGDGMGIAHLQYSGLGNGIEVGNHTINTGGYGRTTFRNFTITATNGSVLGAGLAFNTGYSYYEVDHVQSSQFLWGIVLDQTKLTTVQDSIFETRTKASGAPMWITNGDEWSNTALGGSRGVGLLRYSNGLTILRCQFNQGLHSIVDDGGNSHTFIGNNINDSAYGVYMAAVQGLVYEGNAHEGTLTSGYPNMGFYNTDALTSGNTKGPCVGFSVTANTFSHAALTDGPMIDFRETMHYGGEVTGNHFLPLTTGSAASIDVEYLSMSFCGHNFDLMYAGSTARNHYANIHNDADGNVLYPANGVVSKTNDAGLGYVFGMNTIPMQVKGSMLIGGGTVTANNENLHVLQDADGATGYHVAFFENSAATGTNAYGIEIDYSASTPNNSANWPIYFQDATAPRFNVASDGTVTINTGDIVVGTATTPATQTEACVTGTMAWDADYLYVCTTTNYWERVAIAAW